MGETLFNQFADESALQAQRDFFLNQVLKPIKEGIQGLNVNIGTIDSSQSKRSADELSKTIDILQIKIDVAQKHISELNAKLNEYAKATGQTASAQTKAAEATGAATGAVNEETKALEKNAAARKSTVDAELSSARAAFENAKSKRDSATAELLAAKAALDTVKAKDDVAAAELKGAQAAVDAAKAKRDVLNVDLAGAQATLTAANAKKVLADEEQKALAAKSADAKAAEDASNDYLILTKAYAEATIQAKNYALQLGESHPTTVQAIADANALGDTLAALNAAVKSGSGASISAAQKADAKAAEDASNEFLRLSAAYKDADIAAKNYQLTLGESHPTTIKAVKDAQDLDAAIKKLNATTKSPKGQSNSDIEKALKNEQKLAEDAANDYLQLGKAYNEAALRAKNLQIRLGENHPIAVQATKDANDLANILKRLDNSVGQNQRNVGNYAGAMRGLGFSFTQVARELPSLAVNFQQFALAISNNLPFVADSIAQTRTELAALRKEGKEAPSLFSSIAKSILTWQVALAVGITLFTVLAKDIGKFFEQLFSGSTAFSRAQDKLTTSMAGVNAQAAQQSAELLTLYKVTQDTTQQLDDRVDATNRILEISGEVNEATGESIKLLKDEQGVLKENAGEWEKLVAVLIRVEKTKAVLSLIGDAFKKVVEAQTAGLDKQTSIVGDAIRAAIGNVTGDLGGLNATINKAILNKEETVKEAKAYVDLLQKTLLDGLKTEEFDLSGVFGDGAGADNAVKSIDKLLTGALETLSRRQHEIADNEDNFIAERLKAREKAFEVDKTLLALRTGFEISEARKSAAEQIVQQKGNAKNIAIIQSNLAKEIAYIRDQAGKERREIADKNNQDVIKIEKEFYERLIATVREKEKILAQAKKGVIGQRNDEARAELDEEILIIQEFYDEQHRLQAGNLQQGKTSLAQYNLDKKANARALNRDLINAEIEFQEKLKKTEQLKPDGDTTAIQIKINALKKKLRDEDIADYEAYRAAMAEISKKSVEDIKQAASKLEDELKDAAFNILAGAYDAQLNAIRDQIDAVNELKAADIERISSSTASAEEKAARIKIIESKAQNDREALERRQRQIEKKRAIVERAAAAFTITIAGIRDVARIQAAAAAAYALSMATVPPPFNVIAATFARFNVLKELPFVIASTAAALAGVVGTPIPSYAKGTKSSPEGIAEVAERGPELAIDKDGNMVVYESRGLTYLDKGTRIYTADETKEILEDGKKVTAADFKDYPTDVPETLSPLTQKIEVEESEISTPEKLDPLTQKIEVEESEISTPEKLDPLTQKIEVEESEISTPEKLDPITQKIEVEESEISTPEKLDPITQKIDEVTNRTENTRVNKEISIDHDTNEHRRITYDIQKPEVEKPKPKPTLAHLTKGLKIQPAVAARDILRAAQQERKALLRSFNNNITVSAPDHGDELKKQTKILERLESKSRIAIINNSPIETEAWFVQHFKD